ncbi:MAG: hypothetical protein RQ833_10280 [Sphingomonadaceae bacterium]|nr:hypothetical protein [Sphingomonadaceae bacterium]
MTLIADWLQARETAPLIGRRGDRRPVALNRYADAVRHWLRFFEADRRRLGGGAHSVDDLGDPDLIDRYIAFRSAEAGQGGRSVSPHTIDREIAAVRAAVNWGWRKRRLTSAPYIAGVPHKPRPHRRALLPREVAQLLEAARARPEWHHVHLYAMIALSTLARSQAILEAEHDQVVDGVWYGDRGDVPGATATTLRTRVESSKRRGYAPLCPTLAPWLEGRRGKIVRWTVTGTRNAARARTRGIAPGTPVTRETHSIKRSWAAVMIAAGLVQRDRAGHPLMRPVVDRNGVQRVSADGTPLAVPLPLGPPNILRHTAETELHRRGVPESQIEAAAGHAPRGTGRRFYAHLRLEHMREFLAAVEAYWSEVGKYTQAHLRYQRDTNIVMLPGARAAATKENG